MTDQFGSRTLAKLKANKVCTPAFAGAPVDAAQRPATRRTDLAQVDRLLADHLDRFGEVMRGDVVRARRALQGLLVERIRFTPINIPSVQRTYRLEATLSRGGMLDLDERRRGHVPDGIWPLLQQPFRIVLTVKQAA